MREDDATTTGVLWDRVAKVLTADSFRQAASGFDRCPLIRLANGCGGPSMRLLHWEKVAELGRLPRSDEGHAVDALAGIDRFGASRVEVFMVSHRWLQPSLDSRLSHPDNPTHAKAKALQEFSRWRRKWVQREHGFLPELYYWIDYCCIDQDRAAAALPLLPLWVACCERFLRIETPDYDERMWCRLEPLLSFVFSFADHHVSIGLDFECKWPCTGTLTPRTVLDPRAGKSTDPGDAPRIGALVTLATRLRPANRSRERVDMGASRLKCFSL